MRTGTRTTATAITLILGFAPTVSVAQASGPIPIQEETAGLLSQATVAPQHARLAAFGEFPGARMVAAEIRQDAGRIVYSFEFQVAGHEGTEHVQIDAASGEILCLDYTVELGEKGSVVMLAPDELVSLVEASYERARDTAEDAVENGHVVACKLRVQGRRRVYVFDIEVGEELNVEQVVIDPTTGRMLSTALRR